MLLYKLSKVIPVRMRTKYGTGLDPDNYRWKSTWWQWRNHIWHHRTKNL